MLFRSINGVKEASGNFTLIATMRYLCGDELNLWSGNDDQVLPILALGGLGVISVAANVIPREMSLMCSLFAEGKIAEASELQIKYMDLINALFIEVNPIPVKTALNLLGMNAGHLRMPLCEMSPKNLETLKNAITDAGLSIK